MSEPQIVPADAPLRDRRRTFIAVIALEAVVIVALWLFGRYFGT